MSQFLGFTEFKRIIDVDATRQVKVANDWDSPQFRMFLINLEEHLGQGQAIHDYRNVLVRIEQDKALGIKNEIVAKKFKLVRSYDHFRFLFLPSKAFRSLEIALALLQNGLKTPRPIAIIEDRGRFNRLVNCYYLTEFLECDYSLSQVVNGIDDKLKKKIIIEAAQNFCLMHNAGIIHNDLHTSNILIKNLETQIELYYIDLNRARKKKVLSLSARAKDLGRLALKQQDQSIFFRSYDPQTNDRLIIKIQNAQARRGNWIKFKRKLRHLKSKLFTL